MAISRGPAEAPITINQSITKDPNGVFQYEGIPIDVYRYFDTPMETVVGKDADKLREVAKWAFEDSETVGDALQRIRSLEMRLGTPDNGNSRFDKIYTWVRMQRNIEDLRKRQNSLGRV